MKIDFTRYAPGDRVSVRIVSMDRGYGRTEFARILQNDAARAGLTCAVSYDEWRRRFDVQFGARFKVAEAAE